MRYFNLMLNPVEVEVCIADLEPTGMPADAARMLLRTAAMTTRIMTEIEELKRSRIPRSGWKLTLIHWGSFSTLLEAMAEAWNGWPAFRPLPSQAFPSCFAENLRHVPPKQKRRRKANRPHLRRRNPHK